MPATPINLETLKRVARRIKRERDIPHFEALDLAAQQFGFANYTHSKRALEKGPLDSCVKILVSAKARTNGSRAWVSSRIEVQIQQSLSELAVRKHMKGYLAGCRVIDENNIELEPFDNNILDVGVARNFVRQVARTLQFMDATGLKPSEAKRIYPGGGYWNRPPVADHDSGWYDPSSGAYFLLTEPYPGRLSANSPEQRQWEEKHSFSCERLNWGSIYSDRTEAYILAADRFSESMSAVISKLAHYSRPVKFSDS